MTLPDFDRLRRPVARLRTALVSAQPAAEPFDGDWRPDPEAGRYFAGLLALNLLRLLHAQEQSARTSALAGLNPPRAVLEDHGLRFAPHPDLAAAHMALDAAIAGLLAPLA